MGRQTRGALILSYRASPALSLLIGTHLKERWGHLSEFPSFEAADLGQPVILAASQVLTFPSSLSVSLSLSDFQTVLPRERAVSFVTFMRRN